MSTPHALGTGDPGTSPSVAETTRPSNRSKRTSNACKRCRERKVKCSGTPSCSNCARYNVECVLDAEDRKVVVSERFLNTLKRKSELVHSNSTSPVSKRSRRQSSQQQNESRESFDESHISGRSPSANVSNDNQRHSEAPNETQNESEELGLSKMRNPLASGQSKFVTDSRGRKHFLGPSSTWAYSRQVINMIKDHLQQHESPEIPLYANGNAFTIDWPSVTKIGPLPIDMIPSLDYALYLTNTVKFHLGQMYHLFDEKIFMNQLYEYYGNGPPQEPVGAARLWYVHYLLIMAFGQALLYGSKGSKPTGSAFVSRAIELLPDPYSLFQDPIQSIEILCCLALFLQSIDHRNSAFSYIGQAFRMALTQGLHRELVGSLTVDEIHRHTCVWWTIYILDRKFSSLMGAPSSIHDEDITVPLPDLIHNIPTTKALGAHVALSRVQAEVLSTVYGVEGKLDPSFLKNTRVVLESIAKLATDQNRVFQFELNSSEPTSRVSATLNLYYHQCVVLATRPLLMCLLRDMLVTKTNNDNTHRDIARPLKELLRASYESATKSLRILSALKSQHLLEFFLPFDLESTYSCAFLLCLMSALPSLPYRNPSSIDTAFELLDCMISRGNVVAVDRKDELEKLLEILRLVQLEASTPVIPQDVDGTASGIVGGIEQNRVSQNDASRPVNGLSPDQMLSIAGMLDWEPALTQLSDGQIADDWMWTDADAMMDINGKSQDFDGAVG